MKVNKIYILNVLLALSAFAPALAGAADNSICSKGRILSVLAEINGVHASQIPLDDSVWLMGDEASLNTVNEAFWPGKDFQTIRASDLTERFVVDRREVKMQITNAGLIRKIQSRCQ